MIVVAELGATLLAAAFVEMSLPKHFASKTQQSPIEANAEASIIAHEAEHIKATDASTDDAIDVVLDLRHAEAVQQPVFGDTIVDLREHAEAVTQ